MATKNKSTNKFNCFTTQRSRFFLAVAIFLGIGIAIGYFSNSNENTRVFKTKFSDETCLKIKNSITSHSDFSMDGIDKIEYKERMYAKHCSLSSNKTTQKKDSIESTRKTSAPRTCEIIEEKKLSGIRNEVHADIYELSQNAEIYADLVDYGCPENAEKFEQLAVRQIEILNAMMTEDLFESYVFLNDGEVYKTKIRVAREFKEEGEVAREARRIMEKARRLGEPALHFISEIERLMSE